MSYSCVEIIAIPIFKYLKKLIITIVLSINPAIAKKKYKLAGVFLFNGDLIKAIII